MPQSRTLSILASVISALVFIPTGFLLGRTLPLRNQTPIASTPTPNEASGEVGPTPAWQTYTNQTKNWKTYVDKKYHYSFKYPDTWGKGSACEGDAESDLVRFGPDLLKFPGSDCGTANIPSTAYFYVESTPSFYPGYDIVRKKTLPLDNVDTDYYLFRTKDRSMAGSTEYVQVVIPLKKQSLFLVGIVGQGHELGINKDIFDAILSTFKFVEQ